jgi:hypothetical protein
MQATLDTPNDRVAAYQMALASLPQAGIWFRAIGMHCHKGTIDGVLRALDRLRLELQVLLDCPAQHVDVTRTGFALTSDSTISSADWIEAYRLAIQTLPSADRLFGAVSARGDGVSAAAVFACLEELRWNWYLQMDGLRQREAILDATSAPYGAGQSTT